MKKRIKANFYTIDGYVMERIPMEDKIALQDDPNWRYKDHWWVRRSLPDNRLYSGWGVRYPTKITPEDLPSDYTLMLDYRKHGYIRTAGVKDLYYKPSTFHNHSFKDDFLYISYSGKLPGGDMTDLYDSCDEYIFGPDIISFIVAVEKNSPDIDVSAIKDRMVEQHNLYIDEVGERWGGKKVNTFKELLGG